MAPQGRSAMSEAVLLALSAGDEYRRPVRVPGPSKDGGLLDGRLVRLAERAEYDDEDVALAVKKIREFHNRHGCQRRKLSDPPCAHRSHWRDVAQARVVLWALGLPCGTEMLPLADAILEAG